MIKTPIRAMFAVMLIFFMSEAWANHALRQVEEQKLAQVRNRLASGDMAAAGKVFKDCPNCPEMVWLPQGSFTMGTTSSPHERPVHRVSIGYPLAVGRFDVTFEQWDACAADGDCTPRPGSGWCHAVGPCSQRPEDEGWGRGNRPVIHVSWDDAHHYTQWLSSKTGHAYRLLTESEWEYAARAGTSTEYYWGSQASHNNANYGADRCCSGLAFGRDQWINTSPVGSFAPNGFGLYDMAGNVWQWTEDCWNKNYDGAPADGSAWTSGYCGHRMLRGGSWLNVPQGVGPAGRQKRPSSERNIEAGFRVARTANST